MKFLLIIVIVIAMIIAILLIIALILKKEYTVVRETAIYRSKMDVFEYIKLLKNQNHYSKWATMDPNMKQEFIGTDGTVTQDVIESFWSGGDGFIYVNVSSGSAFIGTFRYGAASDGSSSIPSGVDWTAPDNQFYYDIPTVPEPEALLLTLAGLGVVGWRLARIKAKQKTV